MNCGKKLLLPCAKITGEDGTVSYDVWNDVVQAPEIEEYLGRLDLEPLDIYISKGASYKLDCQVRNVARGSNVVVCLTSEISRYLECEKLIICIEDEVPGVDCIFSIGRDLFSGCVDCQRYHYQLMIKCYHSMADVEINYVSFVRRIVGYWQNGYNAGFSLCSLFPDKPLSLFFPVSDCRVCKQKNLIFNQMNVPEAFLSSLRHTKSLKNNLTGYREIHAADFIDKNALFVGHSSIIKPISSSSSGEGVFLFDAPISISGNVDEIEFSGGKGLEEDQALAGVIAEGLERYLLGGIFSENPVAFSYRNGPDNTIDPIDFLVWPFSTRIFKTSPEFFRDAQKLKFKSDCDNFNHSTVIDWSKARSLSEDMTKYVPSSAVYCPYVSVHENKVCSASSTNGASTGFSRNEAIVQGFLELIERDAFWFHARTTAPVYSIPESHIGQLLIEEEFEYLFMLLPSQFKIPVVQVIIRKKGKDESNTLTARGTGCSFELEKALSRAYQVYVSLERASHRSDEGVFDMDMRGIWSTGRSISTFRNFFSPYQSNEFDSLFTNRQIVNIDEALEYCIDISYRHNMEVLAIELGSLPGHFACVRVLLENISGFDSQYFRNNHRMSSLMEYFNVNERNQYNGSLFM